MNKKEFLQKPVAVLGAGSWGTALALYLSRQGQQVRMWSIEVPHVASMIAERTNNLYLPGFPFPSTLMPTANLAEAVVGVEDIIVAVPSIGYHDTLAMLKPHLLSDMRLVCATKGLDNDTGRLLHTIAREVVGKEHPYAVLSGPSFAREVAAGLPTAVVIASENQHFAQDLLRRFNTSIFRIYLSDDVIGVEIGGVVKNVIAIAAGISDGMELGANARSALITRGLAEMIRLGMALGAHWETFTSLAGVGDLMLTCGDNQSRNRRLGLAIGKGQKIEEAEREIGQVVEGKKNVEQVVQLAKQYTVEMPICETVLEILQGKTTLRRAMENLLTRGPKSELTLNMSQLH